MRDQHQGAGEVEQCFLKNLERGNVEVVGRLVEDEDVGGLEHQASDQDTRAFPATEPFDGLIELLAREEEPGRVACDMNNPILIHNRIGIGCESAAQGETVVDFTHLGEVDDAQVRGAPYGSCARRQFAGHGA